MFDIIAMGEAVIDLTYLGKSEDGNATYERQPGGAPSNMLTAATKWDVETSLIGMVGNDSFGKFLERVIRKQGIHTDNLVFSNDYPTFIALVDLDETGERTFYRIQKESALDQFTLKNVDFEKLEPCKIFHIAGSMMTMERPLTVVQQAMRWAKTNGILLSCDVNWRSALCDENYVKEVMRPYVFQFDIVKVSEEELALISGTSDLEKGCSILRDAGVRLVAVSRGKYGCYYSYAGGNEQLWTYDTNIVDTNAAGDTFTGILLAQICKEKEVLERIPLKRMHEIMDRANAGGAMCAAKRGAIYAIPNREEVEQCRKTILFLSFDKEDKK